MEDREAKFSDLVGQTLVEVSVNESQEEIVFKSADGREYLMYHCQDCCEQVSIEDICGALADLVGSPILRATEDNNSDDGREPPEYADESYTWTFYNIATAKGHVTIRWFGSSNGYYSESVDFGLV